ncbi:MAG: hypothetical protein AAGJ82_05875 [Bacteroidota bacterium]
MCYKKLMLFLLLTTGMIGCLCPYDDPYWNISSFTMSLTDKSFNAPVNGVITGDSIQLAIQFRAEYVASNAIPIRDFVLGSALASLDCADPGDAGMKDPVTSLTVTSSKIFAGVAAGEPLNDFLFLWRNMMISEWVDKSASWRFSDTRRMPITFTERPTPGSTHTFTVRIETESGTVFENSTEAVRWD